MTKLIKNVVMKVNRGQFFTRKKELKEKVFELSINAGRRLEPSAGAGFLCEYFKQNGKETDVAIEIDKDLNFEYNDIKLMNFFDYPLTEKFDTIYGNPPYVKQQLIEDKNKIKSKFSSSLNLYLYFIEKSFYHLNKNGEIVFIIPREFLTSSRANGIRKILWENGTITHIVDYEERKMFDDADPYVIIIRYEKDNFSHKTEYNGIIKNEIYQNGYIKFLDYSGKTLDNYFDIKVGIVSGKNEVYQNDLLGNIEIMCSDFIRTNKKKKYIFSENNSYSKEVSDYLMKHKKTLISRKIRTFNEDNWMEWGAVRNISFMKKTGKCIYVNSKTREENPFFIEDIGFFDGSMLALYPKKNVDLNYWIKILNDKELLKSQGFLVGNKFQFTQGSLSNLIIDENI